MGKDKLAKFADMERYPNVFQFPYKFAENKPCAISGHWSETYFHNANPIVLELGCGKGEYAVSLARMFPGKNFIGVDIKGARMWTGATQALDEGLTNVAFLRTNIEIIDRFFAEDEVEEIWLTFSDPQMKSPRKRLTSTAFLNRYRRFLVDGGVIHLKTDSRFLFTYTKLLVATNHLPEINSIENIENANIGGELQSVLQIRTYYEEMWRARGIAIKYIAFRLPHAGALVEPDVEIETDDYRSYRRTSRSPVDARK
ncbi:MAG: tRNA (guanosine(46)-N7)-methyltransferase TrmB [Prevotella sp.]|nr:tRNA (guanosine(46)-N7)-methyltransferase TrmB [Prevotella sp.]